METMETREPQDIENQEYDCRSYNCPYGSVYGICCVLVFTIICLILCILLFVTTAKSVRSHK